MATPTAADLPADLLAIAADWAACADDYDRDLESDDAFVDEFEARNPGLAGLIEGRHDAGRLAAAFVRFEPGDELHRRLCWLCVNAVRMVRHCWDQIAENSDARDRLAELADVLRGGWFLRGEGDEPDWAPLTDAAVAVENDRTIADCDANRVGPVAAAVAFAARFAANGHRRDAAESLQRVQWAAEEGCWWGEPDEPESAGLPFAAWFVAHALPAAWRCEELPPCESGVPVWRVIGADEPRPSGSRPG